jgi:FMN-dependent NADH-azoreductase
MTTLLHVSSSPRGTASESLALASTFLATYREVHPDVMVETLDLWNSPLPRFGPAGASAKLAVFGGAGADSLDREQAAVWAQAQALADQFTAADAYLFSVPMWNAGVPYVLKQWIDIITQPGMLFGFDPATGYTGLVRDKKAAAIYTSGVYSPGVPIEYGTDFHSSFLNDWLRFAGVTDVTEIRFQPTILTASPAEDRAAAHTAARNAAKVF